MQHLPAQLVYVRRADEWEGLGVVRQGILPANGKRRVLDFGASSNGVAFGDRAKVSGWLFVNGIPLADKRILIASEDPNAGPFKALTKTASDGSFIFSGIPIGNRYLYYPDEVRSMGWHRVRELGITGNHDFGRIDHFVGKLTVHILTANKQLNGSVRANLQNDTAGPFHGHDVSYAAPRRTKEAPYIFENVPPGKYAVTAVFDQRLSARKLVETTPVSLNQTVVLEAPTGSASIHGTIDRSLRDGIVQAVVELHSKDDAVFVRPKVNPDGSFEATDLPSAEYDISMFRVMPGRSAFHATDKVLLNAGEVTQFAFTKEHSQQSDLKAGVLSVTVFTPGGLPVPGCTLRLSGPAGELTPKAFDSEGTMVYHGPPGTYNLTAAYAGFRTASQRAELRATEDAQGNPRDCQLNVTLAPAN